jgi:hypothetical protein
MSSDMSESGWQRLKGWLSRQLRGEGDPARAAPTAAERSDPPLAERVATWEDEGGAPADSVSSVPAPPVDPKH